MGSAREAGAIGRRIALVTGGGKGIGLALVRALLAAGYAVAAADRDAAALVALDAMVAPAERPWLLTLPCDLTTEGAAEDVVAAIGRRFCDVDILVNNAGIGMASLRSDYRARPIRFWEVTPAQWGRFVAVNATVGLSLARLVAPAMAGRGFRRIVNVTTSLGTMVRGGFSAYGGSKAAFEALSAVMAAELAGSGVTVNVLVPGGVTNTAIVQADAGTRARMLQPEIMVPPLLWLVADAASDVTGLRFVAAHWDTSLTPAEAPRRPAHRPLGAP